MAWVCILAAEPTAATDDHLYELSGGGNGITGDDETSENIAFTWDESYTFTVPDPGSCCLTLECYYQSVDDTDPGTLRTTLHEVIDDHRRFPYTVAGTDTWRILELADQDPGDEARILDLYKNESYAKDGGAGGNYVREHSWPRSYGFPKDTGTGRSPYRDCHSLYLADAQYNGQRSNLPFRVCDDTCEEWPTVFNNGQGGGSGVYPGNSNWHLQELGRLGSAVRAMWRAHSSTWMCATTETSTGRPEKPKSI